MLLLLAGGGRSPHAQAPQAAVNPDDILYILPTIEQVLLGSMAAEYQDLKARLGDGPYVKVGFSVSVLIDMTDWNVDTADREAVRARLAGTIEDIDNAIAEARAGGYPLSLSLMTAIRGAYDGAQTASEQDDRRNMMWYSDNALAPGWWTHSRYARKQFRVQEAYMREVGRVIADRMARYPETLVHASGDGEVELALDRANADPALTVYADYSPFAVAEFRDWIRAGGLYAAGQPLEGQAYANSSRYAGDGTPGTDTNGDGHTLNGDFGTAFTTWNLRAFDWSLADGETDGALPLASPFDPNTVSNPGGFDAPRVRGVKPADYFASSVFDYWKLWLAFRSAMLQHHNTEVAKWITTSPSVDSGTAGAVVSKNRWSSYQIPGDYLFNGSPSSPNGRYESSGSSWTTGDVSPYAEAGYTSFNLNFNCDLTKPTGPGSLQDGCGGPFPYFLTLKGLAPAIASRNLRFSLLEWHPSVPVALGLAPPENPFLFSNELTLLETYRPTVLSPFIWNDTIGLNPIKGAGTETMLRQLVSDLKNGLPPDPRVAVDGASPRQVTQPFTLTGAAYDLGKVRGSGRDTGMDSVTLRAVPASGGSAIVIGSAAYGETRSEVSAASGAQFWPSGFHISVTGLSPGAYDVVASGHSTVTGLTTDSAPVRVTVMAGAFSLDHASLHFTAVRAGGGFTAMTSPQDVLLTQGGAATAWTATPNQPWLSVSPASGTGSQPVTVSINAAAAPVSGTSTATVTFAAINGLADPIALTVTLAVTTAQATAAPVGSFDTPTDNSTVFGSIAVTGWAVDDVEVSRVELWRDAHPSDPANARFGGADARGGKIFIGYASFVEGARPDIEGLFPNAPRASRGGWGYIMLTRGLPWDGMGPFKIWAFVFDAEGHMVNLGGKTITVNNAASKKPFGAIDTPGQGETVSGLYADFGWVIPALGQGTIPQENVRVYIDGVFVGNPGGLSRRSDLDDAFGTQGYDTSQANRVLVIDTTQFANGVHTIGWLVTDTTGNADGIGSRFIRINNTPSIALRGNGTSQAGRTSRSGAHR